MEEQLNIVEEVRKMEESKKRAPRAPTINIHHVFRFYAEAQGDFYKVLAAMISHYNFNFKPQQIRNVYARANKELAKRGVQPLSFAPARNNEKYIDDAVTEWVSKGALKPASKAATPKK